MKAWHVFDKNDPSELSDILQAETRGKAKIKSWPYLDYGSDFTDLRARRIPELDGNEPLTTAAIYKAGFWVSCDFCGEYVLDGEGEIASDVFVYHSSCAERARY